MVLEILRKDVYTIDQKYYKNTLAIMAFFACSNCDGEQIH